MLSLFDFYNNTNKYLKSHIMFSDQLTM